MPIGLFKLGLRGVFKSMNLLYCYTAHRSNSMIAGDEPTSPTSPLKSQPSSEQWPQQLQVKGVIGRGTFGTVHLAYWKTQNKHVAIKKVAKNPKYKNRELELLTSLHHECIVSMLGHYESKEESSKTTFSNMVLEYVPTTLFTIIRAAYAKSIKLTNEKVILYARKMLEGLAYLHQHDICHRDIKPSNILIDENEGRVKICDFGSSKQLKKDEKSLTYICSRYYRAPELILGCSQYSTKVDIWSLGCVIAEALTTFPLFPGDDNTDQLKKIIKVIGAPTKDDLQAMHVEGIGKIVSVEPTGLGERLRKGNKQSPEEMIDLLSKMLVLSPDARISARQALNHPVFSFTFPQ